MTTGVACYQNKQMWERLYDFSIAFIYLRHVAASSKHPLSDYLLGYEISERMVVPYRWDFDELVEESGSPIEVWQQLMKKALSDLEKAGEAIAKSSLAEDDTENILEIDVDTEFLKRILTDLLALINL